MNLLQTILAGPENVAATAYKFAIGAHIISLAAFAGQIAQITAQHQPLLNSAFGEQKGTIIGLGATVLGDAISSYAKQYQASNPPAVNITSETLAPLELAGALGNAQPAPTLIAGVPPTIVSGTLPTGASSTLGVSTEL